MDVGLIQKAERQMMMDGKSASEIDAMKSAYRKQVFNPQGYSQAAGLGSFASGGEAYGPPPVKGPDPQGIASFGNGGEADKVREFGNLEYELEIAPFLDPVARYGFDPDKARVRRNPKDGSHYNISDDGIVIGDATGTSNLSEQAHEFRHRGLQSLLPEFLINVPTLKRELSPEKFNHLKNFFDVMQEQRLDKMRGEAGPYEHDRHEMFAEFFEKPYEYNRPAQFVAVPGEDPKSRDFMRVMNINPETREPYTDAEREEYAARTGTVIKKMLTKDTVEQQMDRLETSGQDEFRSYLAADPDTRTGDAIFEEALAVQEFAESRNSAVKNYYDGGEVMNGIGTLNGVARNMTRGPRGIGAYQQFADGGSVPRQTMIQNQPHMLAYINPEEEQMLRENGGAGLPGPGGVPAYWNLFEPSTWKGGENYTPGAGFEGFTSGPSKLAVATSIRPQSRPEELRSQPSNPNSQTDGNGNLVNPVVAPPVVAPQGITSLEDTGSRQSALKGSGILDGIGSFINNLPTTKIFKGIARDATMGFRAGFGNRESQIKRLREHADEDGKFTYTPSQVDDYFSATDSSLARLRAQQERNQDNNRDEVTGISQTCPPGFVFDAALAQCVPIDDGITSGLPPAPEYISSSFVPNTQMFADGGPVYMSDGTPRGGIGSIRPQSRPQDFKVDERVEEKNEARASLMETIYDLESNSDYNKWNLKARNKPKTPLTSMTVREIMNYQKDDNGPAAGAGQIKHDTLKYLIDNAYISSRDVFSPEVQDKAVRRLIDRRGFVSWFNGEIPTEEFGSDMAKEFASLPLLEARIVKGKERDRGQSRFENNTALMGADSWQDVLESSINIPQNSGKGESVPSYFLNEGTPPDTSLRPIGRPLSIETPSYQEIRPQSRPESLYPAMDQGVEAALMEALQGQNLEEKYSVENMEQQLAAPQMRPQMRPESAPQMRPQMRPETLGIMSAIR